MPALVFVVLKEVSFIFVFWSQYHDLDSLIPLIDDLLWSPVSVSTSFFSFILTLSLTILGSAGIFKVRLVDLTPEKE